MQLTQLFLATLCAAPAILAAPAPHSRLWRATGKRLYKLIARRVFGYWDNEGKGRVRD